MWLKIRDRKPGRSLQHVEHDRSSCATEAELVTMSSGGWGFLYRVNKRDGRLYWQTQRRLTGTARYPGRVSGFSFE
jgi:hypothetical protein